MPTSLIKDSSDVFASLICRLANLSFPYFPSSQMYSRFVKSHLWSRSQVQMSANHRITDLSLIKNTFGQILERLAQNKLRQHLSASPDYNTSQWAYRALHSTEAAMAKVVNDLLTAVNSGKPTALLSVDISAAFDLLDHDRLLNRASELFGLSDQVIHRQAWVIFNRPQQLRFCWQLPFIYCFLQNMSFTGFSSWTTRVFRVYHTCQSFHLYIQRVNSHQKSVDAQLYTSIDLSSDHDIDKLSNCADAVTRWHLDNNLQHHPSQTDALVTDTRQQNAKVENSSSVDWLIDWLVFYGTSTQDRSICANLPGGDYWLRRLRIANEEQTKTYSCVRYNVHTHAATNNRYALLA